MDYCEQFNVKKNSDRTLTVIPFKIITNKDFELMINHWNLILQHLNDGCMLYEDMVGEKWLSLFSNQDFNTIIMDTTLYVVRSIVADYLNLYDETLLCALCNHTKHHNAPMMLKINNTKIYHLTCTTKQLAQFPKRKLQDGAFADLYEGTLDSSTRCKFCKSMTIQIGCIQTRFSDEASVSHAYCITCYHRYILHN